MKAKQNGKNSLLWGFLTIVSYFVFEMAGLLIVIFFFCRNAIDMNMFNNVTSANANAMSQQFNEQLQNALTDKPERALLVFAFGIGGFLLIRYLLERPKKGPEVHWMDKMGEQ